MVSQTHEWSKKALRVCSPTENSPLLTVEELKRLVKEAEHNPLLSKADLDMLGTLKQELRKVKLWFQKVTKLGIATDGSATASKGEGAGLAEMPVSSRSEVVSSLLAEAKTINVDVKEQVDALVQMCATYCLCRHLVPMNVLRVLFWPLLASLSIPIVSWTDDWL